MILTAFAPRRARPAAAARVWWRPRTADNEPSLEASSLVARAHRDVNLVLGDDRPLPDLQSDVDQLLSRFSTHLEVLLRIVDVSAETNTRFARMRRLGQLPRPVGHVESRIHLVLAAESVQELLAHVRAEGACPAGPRRPRGWWSFAHRFPLSPVDGRWARDREEAHV
ncbi:hypothetical protein ACFVOR_35400 [Streptomyces sp. NPDC057837]|uniref:hypothetical protein n=1 Tax=Streptomyces sp. NPDC057837 TaxID=3346260 RepID=UPI003673D5F8